MKKLKIFVVIAVVMVIAFGSLQACMADSLDVDVENVGNDVKLVFTINGKKYEIKLNPFTGDVAKDDSTADKISNNTDTADTSDGVTLEKAKEIALADAGVENAEFKKAKTDYDDGRKVYELEFYTDSAEYEYEIDAQTGSITDKDVDYRSNKSSTGSSTGSGTSYSLTSDQAEEIVLADAGVSRSSVKYINSHIDKDDGIFVYEIEFVVNNTEYDYEINADNGAVVSKDVEYH